MGQFFCKCGHVISDTMYPCPNAGSLMWQTEKECWDEDANQAVSDFLDAVRRGTRAEWIRSFFLNGYPLEASDAEVVDDIYDKTAQGKEHFVYSCPECGRLYVQIGAGNEWDCFERADT